MGLHSNGTASKYEPIPFAQLRTSRENVTTHLPDTVENAQAALHGQSNFPAKPAGQGMDERCATLYQGAGAVNLEIHQCRPVGRPVALRDIYLADVKAREVAQRYVNPLFFPVDRNILPKIDQLQGSADAVGLFQMLRFGSAKQVQYQTPDRIGRAATIVEQFRVIGVSRFHNILRESVEQVAEELDGQGMGSDHLGEFDE